MSDPPSLPPPPAFHSSPIYLPLFVMDVIDWWNDVTIFVEISLICEPKKSDNRINQTMRIITTTTIGPHLKVKPYTFKTENEYIQKQIEVTRKTLTWSLNKEKRHYTSERIAKLFLKGNGLSLVYCNAQNRTSDMTILFRRNYVPFITTSHLCLALWKIISSDNSQWDQIKPRLLSSQ